jgi:hypothetical protein
MSAGGGYPPPINGALLTPLSLACRQGMLSMRKLANFLPVGKDFTIPARNFLPVVPSELDSDIFWQDILGHLSFALCLCARKGNLQSLQLSCLVPATPG